MQKIKISLLSLSYFLTLVSAGTANAVKVENLWDKTDAIPNLSQIHIVNDKKALKESIAANAQLFFLNNAAQSGLYEYRLRTAFIDSEGVTHARYDEFYKNLPILWADTIVHNKKSQSINGVFVTEIEKDLSDINPRLTKEQAIDLAKHDFMINVAPNSSGKSKAISSQLVIYPYAEEKNGKLHAHLAYQINYYTTGLNDRLANPNYLIDANSGEVLKYFDSLKHAQALVGTGPGGNTNPNVTNGQYNYGSGASPLLGYILIQTDTPNPNQCTWGNNMAAAINLKNATNDPSIFPILKTEEFNYPTEVILGCNSGNNYLNANDNGQAPVNGGRSPDNDTLFYATQTYNMYVFITGKSEPLGSNSPSSPAVKYYININSTDAVAYSAGCGDSYDSCFGQQVVLGNGQTQFYPQVTYDTVGHETTHIYIDRTSRLVYAEQSGGINESFADIAGAALGAYIGSTYPFFPPISSLVTPSFWAHGALDSKTTPALRYLFNPPLDGNSIKNVADFVPGMDVHYSSGIYNYVFYLFAYNFGNTYPDVLRAFKYIVDANDAYWNANSNFYTASCGVIQVAYNNRKNFPNDWVIVSNAFNAAGLHCMRGLDTISVTE